MVLSLTDVYNQVPVVNFVDVRCFVCGYVRIDVNKSLIDQCGTVTDDALHHVWVVVICISFIRFVIKVRASVYFPGK